MTMLEWHSKDVKKMLIQKRNGLFQDYDNNKIETAIKKAFCSLSETIKDDELKKMIADIEKHIIADMSVEAIQDLVEETLMKHGYLQVAKAYILYRQKHTEQRLIIDELLALLGDQNLKKVLLKIHKDYPQEEYSLQLLLVKFKTFYKEGMSHFEALKMLMKASVELISKEAPKWEMISARFLTYDVNQQVDQKMNTAGRYTFYERINYLAQQGYYGQYILES